jgi:thiamine pyrophosphate-dependent acetolactate synthase large subunit-like protein
VEDPDELDSVLQAALTADRPTFIDVVTECETTEIPLVEKWRAAARKEEKWQGL